MKESGGAMSNKKKSIICNDPVCYECGRPQYLQLHHCLHGTANRTLADEDGLVVYLCVYCHNRLHDGDTRLDNKLMRVAERAYLETYKKTIPDFIARYGKNYL